MVTSTEIQAYWDEYALYPQIGAVEWGSREFFEQIKEDHDKAYADSNEILNIPSHKGKTVLEICCGVGFDALELAKHGAKVTFISPSPRLIELTRKYFAYQGLDANLKIGNGDELPFQANSFDVVIARGILMFTAHPENVLSEIFRILKPDGEVVAHLHNKYSWYVLLARLSRTNLIHEVIDPPVSWRNSIKDAKRMFRNFSSVRFSYGRFPWLTSKRSGLLAQLYNRIFIPFAKIIPKPIIRPWGYYIIIKAEK